METGWGFAMVVWGIWGRRCKLIFEGRGWLFSSARFCNGYGAELVV